jgi:RHS repeat-associated protein
MTFVYGNDDERIKMDYNVGGTNQYTRYYAENVDRQENTNGSYKEWTYIFAPSGLCAVVYNSNGSTQTFYAITDHLGSPVMLTAQNQSIVEEYSFDSWGRRRNPSDWSYYNLASSYILLRGYTFHEHHDEFAIINANARIYDPVLGRFIQPDNYIQAPHYLQNFNRYAYCVNNPMRYSDPSGNYAVLDAWVIGFIRGAVHGISHGTNWAKEGWDRANRQAGNDAKIWGGLFVSDKSNTNWQRFCEVFSRLTFQAPQTVLGLAYNLTVNEFGNVDDVQYFHGATVVYGTVKSKTGMTLGSYISLPSHNKADGNEIGLGLESRILDHEYGHYLQSRKSGFMYLFKYAIPSAFFNQEWTERDANLRSAKYFEK